jgi:hypothetical protein
MVEGEQHVPVRADHGRIVAGTVSQDRFDHEQHLALSKPAVT